MTIQELIKLEDKAKEVWVISPSLHYDVENADFSELVSVNLGEKTKYRYIVPASKTVVKNLDLYQKKYNLTDENVISNFLLLPESEFNPFITEIAIYDANTNCKACSAVGNEDGKDIMEFSPAASKSMADSFAEIWKKYKRVKP